MTYFCSSDIHSFFDEWMLSLKNKKFDIKNPSHVIIICGDLFDRGRQSTECFNFVKELSKQNRLIYIRGNHEDLLCSVVDDLNKNKSIGNHHISNGTIQTLADILDCSSYDVLYRTYDLNKWRNVVEEDLVSFVNNTTVDYFELSDKVFVHGWVPTTCDENRQMIVHDNWRDGDWKEARWENGIEMWHFKVQPLDKCVVCGHWHCSYGWSHYDRKYKEFPQKTHEDFEYSFNPYIKDGLIAIDACTAYSGKVNVVVFDDHGCLIEF